jgi:hypothetical protein
MPRPSKRAQGKRKSAARARAGKVQTLCGFDSSDSDSVDPLTVRLSNSPIESEPLFPDLILIDSDTENECSWTGGVNHTMSSDSALSDSDSYDDWESDSDFSELEADDLIESLRAEVEKEMREEMQVLPTLYQKLTQPVSSKEWRKAESNRALGYNGLSSRSNRRHAQEVREKDAKDANTRQS